MNRPSVILVAAALALGACGKVGVLDQPAPLYGDKAKAKYEAQKEAAAAAKAKKEDNGEPESLPTDRIYDPNADPSPQRALPVPGAPELPNAPPPQGVLPDPFNHPQ